MDNWHALYLSAEERLSSALAEIFEQKAELDRLRRIEARARQAFEDAPDLSDAQNMAGHILHGEA